MRKVLLIIGLILMISLVSADVSETNYIKYGILEDDSSVTMTSTAITNSNIIGYVCTSASCGSVSSLFMPATNIAGDNIVVNYPTSLLGAGYGFYVYKNGYFPYEFFADWSGTGTAPNADNYLIQKRNCNIPVSNLVVSYSSGNIIVTADVTSPVSPSGPLDYVPSAVESYYAVNADVNLTISGTSGYSEVKTVNLAPSNTTNVRFSRAFAPGNYNISVRTSTSDGKCLNTGIRTLNQSNFIVNDVTAPSITVSSPTNSSYSSNPISVSFSATDDVAVDTLWFFNGTRNLSYATPINLNLANGSYTFIFYANDSSGNTNSLTRTFSVDVPVVDTTAPGSVSGIYVIGRTNTTITWGWTNPSDSDFNGTLIYINGVYDRTLNSLTNQTTFNGLIPGTNYTITINTIDLSGNVNGTNISNTVSTLANGASADTTAPLVTIISPLNMSYNYSNVLFNVSLNELGLAVFSLDNGITNVSMGSTDNVHFTYLSNLGNGNYLLRVYAQDLSGNVNNSVRRAFSVNLSSSGGNVTNDTTAPVVSISSPVNMNYTLNVTSMVYSASDNVALNGCWYSLNNGIVNNSVVCNTPIIGLLANQGTNTWRIYARDGSGNIGSASVSFFVNTSSGNNNHIDSGDDDNEDGNDDYGVTRLNSTEISNYRNLPPKWYEDSSSGVITLGDEEINISGSWGWIILMLLFEIIIVLLIILFVFRRKR